MRASDLTEEYINGRRVLVRPGLAGSPLVLVLHPGGGSPEQAARDLPFADLSGFATVAYLAGSPDAWLARTWVVGNGLTRPASWGSADDQDVRHLHAVRRFLEARCRPSRTLIAGHSNGGHLALLYAAVHGEEPGYDVVTWGAILSGPQPFRWSADPSLRIRRYHGNRDPYIPISGPVRIQWTRCLSVDETGAYFGSQSEAIPYSGDHDVPRETVVAAMQWFEARAGAARRAA